MIHLMATALAGTLYATDQVSPVDLAIPTGAVSDEAISACVDGELPALDAAVVTITPDSLSFAGTEVFALEAGEIPAVELRGVLASGLYEVLVEALGEAQRLSTLGCDLPIVEERRVLIAADGTIPFRTLTQVLYTVGQASFDRLELRVDGPVRASERPAVEGAPNRVVTIDGDGLALLIGDQTTRIPCTSDPCTADSLPIDGLREPLSASIEGAGVGPVVLVPQETVPWSSVLDVARAALSGPDGAPLASGLTLAAGLVGEGKPARWDGRPGVPEPLPAEGASVVSVRLPQVGQATPEKPAKTVRVAGPVVLGALPREVIDQTIRADAHTIRGCYDSALRKAPDLAGKVVVKFVIDPDGRVSKAAAETDTVGVPKMTRCVLKRFERLVFPEPTGGGVVVVSYPLSFSPQ